MLMYRAASFWTNVYAPELSMGMKTVEEQQDIIDITDYEDVTDKVEKEKTEKGNKTNIGFDAAPQSQASEQPQNQEQAPKADAPKVDNQPTPGF